MTWTATTCDNLKYALPIGATTLELASANGTTDLCALIGDPAARHVVLEVYTASGSETVVAYGCKSGAVQITRANGGSTEKSWPVGACVRTVQIIEGALCGTETTGLSGSECCSVSTVWGGVTICPELSLDLTNPDAPVLCLTPSGVAAGERCGGRLKVDTYGRVTYMAQDFPQACLPIFDPCACGDTNGGVNGVVTADEVTFAGAGNCLLTGGTVQQAIVELEAALCSLSGSSGSGIAGIIPGNGIDISGGPSSPVINLAAIISAGTYGAFDVNEFGQVTNYTPPAATGLPVAATDPLHVAPDSFGVYTFTVDSASETDSGVVQLASSGDFTVNAPIPSDRVISWGFLQTWWNSVKNFICDLANVPEMTAAERGAAKIPVCVGGSTVAISPSELVSGGGGAYARVQVDAAGAIVTGDNVASVLPLAGFAGGLVTMQAPAPVGYHVCVSQYSAAPLVPVITVANTTQFYVAWYAIDGTGQVVNPIPWSAAVFRGEP